MRQTATLFASSFLFVIMLAGCAETPQGTFVLNEETVENFFDGGAGLKSWDPPADLNLVWDQPVVAAEIPPVAAGMIRLQGVLNSVGPYYAPKGTGSVSLARGSTFTKSVFGMYGPANGGTAWFYADINPQSGQIASARAYMYGFDNGVCDMRMPANGSYGVYSPAGFTLTIDGMCHFPKISGANAEYALLVVGEPTPAISGKSFNLRYIIDNNGKFSKIPANPAQNPQIYDYGSGSARTAQ